jgi:hypothetical protein
MLRPGPVQALLELEIDGDPPYEQPNRENVSQHRLSAYSKRYVRRKKGLRLYFLIDAASPF